jgi:O-antigen/teichoic acid export membrane protein
MHEWLFRLLVATEYRGSSYYLPWVVLAGGLFAGSQVLTLKLMSEMKTSLLTIVKITTALIGVLCNVLGAIYFGMKGVVGALVVFSVIYFVWMVVIAQNSLTKNRDKH